MSIASGEGGDRRRALAGALPWVLLLLFVGRGLLAMRADGTTVDEPDHLFYGQRALASGTFLRDLPQWNSKTPVAVLGAVPVALAARGRALGWPQQLFLARLPSLLLGALLGWLVWHWARALFGLWGGALALFLYSFCPNVLAHTHLATTDIATALGMFAAVWCLWSYLGEPSRGRLLRLAAVFGTAQLAKASALLLVPIFAVILGWRALGEAWRAWRQRRAVPPGVPPGVPPDHPADRRGVAAVLARHAARGARLLLALAAGAVVVLNLGFWFERTGTPLSRYTLVGRELQALARVPVLRDVPLPLPYAYVQGLDMLSRDVRAGMWSYLRGRYSRSGFRSYFLWALLVKVPVATLLLLALALGLWGAGRVRAPGADDCLIIPVLVLLLYFSLFFELDIGVRYILPAFPFLFVFGARLATAGSGRPLLAGLLVWLTVSSLRAHPHYIPYFNEVAGGPDQGGWWLIDSNLDWGQDREYMRQVYARKSPVRVLFNPSGPLAGRVAMGISDLVGTEPADARHNAWLRDNFRPIATIGHSWRVYDVTEAGLARCCAGLPRVWMLEDLDADLALAGEPSAGGEGVKVRFVERLNDGELGTNDAADAARTVPLKGKPVHAWFGISSPAPQRIGRVVAFPGFYSRGEEARKFLALDYVFQSWDGAVWRDIPGTRVAGNRALKVEHRFPPLLTRGLRIVIERERNELGQAQAEGAFRAACLEIAAYPPGAPGPP